MPALTTYFASIGFEINNKSIRKVDSALTKMQKKLKAFGKTASNNIAINLVKFNVNQKALTLALGNALDIASKQVTFQITNFSVDHAALRNTLNRASTRGGVNSSFGGGYGGLSAAEYDRRQGISASAAFLRHQRALELAALRNASRGGSGRHAVAGGLAGGIAGGGLSRAYGPALALGLGGYGLSALNQRNQEVVSAQLQSSAVVQQAGGTAAQGADSFQYLRSEASRVGFNYLDASGDYNKLISGLTGSGVGLKESQKVFSGFAELARVNKLDKTTQNRLFRALSQVAGKGKLQAEELTSQIAEALPGGTALFAEAYQAKIGGNKTGQAAIQQLMDDMKKGKVTSDILTYAGTVASERANKGGALTAASQASQAEQARYQNQVSDLAVVASNSGVESGFARLFRALSDGLKESGPLVEGLARGFDNVSKYVSFALLSAQSFQRLLDGRDSYLGNKFFPTIEERSEVLQFVNAYKGAMTEIGALGKNIYNGWADLIKLFNSDAFVNLRNWANTVSNTVGTINKLAGGDTSGAGDAAKAAGFGYLNYITTPAQKALDVIGLPGSSTINRLRPEFDPAGYETQQRARQDEVLANRRRENFSTPLGMFPIEKAGMPSEGGAPSPLAPKADLTLKMDVKITAANPEDFKTQFESSLADIVHQTLDKYSEKE